MLVKTSNGLEVKGRLRVSKSKFAAFLGQKKQLYVNMKDKSTTLSLKSQKKMYQLYWEEPLL